MTLFPQLDLNYYIPEDDQNLLVKMDRAYTEAITINQSFWSEADIDVRFREGDQTLWNDIYGNLPAFRRRQFNFNRIRRICNMISGYQRKHRKSIVVTPRENSDSATSSQLTKLMFWAMDQTDGLEIISDTFDGAITTGLNLLNVWWDWRSDPISGDPRIDKVAYNSFLIDPFFRKHDLSDCNFVWQRRYYTKQEIMSLLPLKESELEGLYAGGYRDGKFQFLPESYQYGMRNLMTYDEYWHRAYRKQTLLVDPQNGATLEWKGNEKDLKEFISEHTHIQVVKQDIPTVRLGIVVQGRVMYHGPHPMGIDRYPFVPIFGYFNPDMPYFPWRIQGVVRGLRDAQYLYNRRKVIELDILESQVNSGMKFKEDSLVNPKDIYLQGQGRGIALKREADMNDVQTIPPPAIPPTVLQLSEILGKEMQEISGVNEELLGSAEDDKAGILSMLRQGAGLTTLQILYDQLDYSQKLLGTLMIELIQSNFTPGKVKRIIQEEPSPEFYNKVFGKYDSVVEEGLNTSTQRQLQFAQLLNLREMGIPVPTNILVETSTLTNKQQLIEGIAKEEEQQQKVQEEQHQMQIELLKAQIEKLQASAVADSGLGIERASRVQENQSLAVERVAEAQKDRNLGTLHLAQALKELDSIELDNVQKLWTLVQAFKQHEKVEEAQSAEVADVQNEQLMQQVQQVQSNV
ncbi:hypothetical protein LCGC14_1484490 [marine sediment metagenome]|uniref:Portal protein n=1 Tax=marine sediment metagenome TaxID=412755 RepID=A0A0F9MAC6_9ZZZZ